MSFRTCFQHSISREHKQEMLPMIKVIKEAAALENLEEHSSVSRILALKG